MTALAYKSLGDDLTLRIPLGAGLTALAALAAQPVTAGAPALLVADAVVSSGAALLTLTGGGDGALYRVTGIGTVAGVDQPFAAEVAVIDPAWSTAGGPPAWLSVLELAQRVGFDELVRASSRTGAGTYDRSFVIAALQDAQAEAEANLSGRYALPLVPLPDILRTIVADLAWARLHPRGAPEGVADAAKVARRQLERIADGALQIAATPAVADTTDAPILIDTGGRKYRDGVWVS